MNKKVESYDQKDKNDTKYFVDIKLTLTALVFLLLTLLDYKKCGYRDDFCYNFPYGFYEILKFVICGYFLYRAHVIWQNSKVQFGFIVSVLAAITYNPFVKMAFEKSDWRIINIVTIFIVIILSKNDFHAALKKSQEVDEEETFLHAEKIVRENMKNNPTELKTLDELKEKQPDRYKEHIYALLYKQAKEKNKTFNNSYLPSLKNNQISSKSNENTNISSINYTKTNSEEMQQLENIEKYCPDEYKSYVYELLRTQSYIPLTKTVRKHVQDNKDENKENGSTYEIANKKISLSKMKEISDIIRSYNRAQTHDIMNFFSMFSSLKLESGYKLVSFEHNNVFYPYIKKDKTKNIKSYDEYKQKNALSENETTFASNAEKILFDNTPDAYMEFLVFNYYVKLFFFERSEYGGKLILTDEDLAGVIRRNDFGKRYSGSELKKLLETPIPTECSYQSDGSVIMSLIKTDASYQTLLSKYKITNNHKILFLGSDILTEYKILF